MATNRELEARVKQLEALIEQIAPGAASVPSDEPTERPDFIDFGSPRHAVHLGLILLDDGESPPMQQRIILPGKDGQLYCLEDELGVMRFHPGLTLDEAAPVILRQKIGEYEAGPPQVPDSAPPMWTPTPAAELVL
jgi:hypothetical protein